jgi:hypothetical protein
MRLTIDKRIFIGLVVVILGALIVRPTVAQDTTTMLSKFLADLRSGALGGTQSFTSVKLTSGSNTSTLTGTGAGSVSLSGTTPFLQFGGTTSSFPALKFSSTSRIDLRLADDSTYADLRGGISNFNTSYQVNGNVLISATAPTSLSSCGGGTAPSFLWTNGTGAFEIITGSSTPVSTCTWTMPTITNKWVCDATDITTASTSVFYMKMTASSTNSVTVTNFNTAGAATAVVASDHLLVKCTAGG